MTLVYSFLSLSILLLVSSMSLRVYLTPDRVLSMLERVSIRIKMYSFGALLALTDFSHDFLVRAFFHVIIL